jgi:hypothetical protein
MVHAATQELKMENEKLLVVVPAQPGFTVWFYEPGGEMFSPYAVIAWMIEREILKNQNNFTTVSPITIEGGPGEGLTHFAIEQPNGTVDFAYDQLCQNLEEARVYVRSGLKAADPAPGNARIAS